MAVLTVIIPVYNVEEYLAACLDSVIGQTYRDIDIICVDDGSTDNSAKILAEYAARDDRIQIITQKNGGLSSARNTGLAAAKTELIAFVDSDDTVQPDTYERAIAVMGPDIDFVHFGTNIVGGTDLDDTDSDQEYYRIKFDGKTPVVYETLTRSDCAAWNKIFRKSILDKYGIRFPVGLRYEDAYFWNIYGIRSHNGFFIRDKFYNYLRRVGSIMHQTFSCRAGISIDHLIIAIRMYEYLKEHDLYSRHKYFWGKRFWEMFDLALAYEQDEAHRKQIYDTALDFFEREKIDFSEFVDLNRLMYICRNRMWNARRVHKKLGGLIQIRERQYEERYLFCGIPVMRVKYTTNRIKGFLFCLIRVRNKSVTKHMEV